MTRRFRCLPGSFTSAGPDFVYTPPSVVGPPVPPIVDNGDQPPSLGRPIDEGDGYTGQVGSLFPGQPLEVNYEPGTSPEDDYIHVLATGDVVTVRSQQGGTLPGGLRADINYYVEVLEETSINLYRDHERTQLITFSGISDDCGCVPIYYTWMDQWPPEQTFPQVQTALWLLEPEEYVPVLPLGVVQGMVAQVFLYPTVGLTEAACGPRPGGALSGQSSTNEYSFVSTGLTTGLLARTSTGFWADAIRYVGFRLQLESSVSSQDAPLPPDPLVEASWLTNDIWNAALPSDSLNPLDQWLMVEDGPAVEPPPPPPPPEVNGVTWLEADLWNLSVLSDDHGPGGLAHAVLGIEDVPAVAPEPEPEPELNGITWLEADLWNLSILSDDSGPGGLAHAALGIEDVNGPPPPPPPEMELRLTGITWTESDLWNLSAIDDEQGEWPLLHASLGVEAVTLVEVPA